MVDSCDDIVVSYDTIQFVFVPFLAIFNMSFCHGTPCTVEYKSNLSWVKTLQNYIREEIPAWLNPYFAATDYY